MKINLYLICLIGCILYITTCRFQANSTPKKINPVVLKKKGKKTAEERRLFVEERMQHEYNLQKNPLSGIIPIQEKRIELNNSIAAKQKLARRRSMSSNTYISRGPSNYGGRTRSLVIDLSDPSGNTMIAGGVSSGVFRTTDGGASWSKVSANDEIHNVSAIAQDPRPGFQNIWYYATGERLGNSASLGSFYFGDGIWKSEDGGLTWNIIQQTSFDFTSFDSRLDLISALEVSPINGDLLIAATARIYRFDGTTLTTELNQDNSNTTSDVLISSSGRVYAAFDGGVDQNGVWTSPTGNGSWTRIAENGTPTDWLAQGRIVLGAAPSNDNIIYALYVNGASESIEADLWKYNLDLDTWTNYSSKLPDEPDGDLAGNDPFAVQGGYDLVVSVKPDDENFVTIGGTNIYKIEDILNDETFTRIGGYISNTSYGLYNTGGVEHHPDIHALVFDPNNPNIFFSGTDGGVHKTSDVNAEEVAWESLNNNYITYQFYHVALDPTSESNLVIGGTQDNGTKYGGTDVGLPDNTSMQSYSGGDGVAVGIARRGENEAIQIYAGTQNGNMFTNLPEFRTITPDGSESQFVTYFYLDPDNTTNLYYAGLSELYKTNDAENITALTWENLGALPNDEPIRTFATTRGAYNPLSSYLLIGGGNGGIFRLDDPQNATSIDDAINITPFGADTNNGAYVSGLAIHPNDPDTVLVVYSNYGINSIFLTLNARAEEPLWSLVENNLNAHSIRSAAIAEVDGEVIYFVGTARGLYASNDPLNNDWEIEGVNEIGLAVVSGLVYRTSDSKLLVGTHGNGMFETTVESTLSANENSFNTTSLSIFPNPVVSTLSIKTAPSIQKIAYSIMELSGKQILKGITENKRIGVETLRPGLYILGLKFEGKEQFLKFIKK